MRHAEILSGIAAAIFLGYVFGSQERKPTKSAPQAPQAREPIATDVTIFDNPNDDPPYVPPRLLETRDDGTLVGCAYQLSDSRLYDQACDEAESRIGKYSTYHDAARGVLIFTATRHAELSR